VTTIINGSSPSITFSDGSAQTSATRPFLNRIINGAMVINQRATTLTDSGYATDRWAYSSSTSGKASVAQSSTAPTGFNNSLLSTSSAATVIGSTDLYIIDQKIEGFNTADLGWGTANAKTVTLSFWVRSSLTGTFSGVLGNSGPDRSYPFTYTISVANTFEYKTVTVAGDTTGTWGTTNGTGIRVIFSLGCGATRQATAGAWTGTSNIFAATGETQLLATSGATLYLTGIQLEVGSTATSFDYRPYTTELSLCQRYAWKCGGATSDQYLAGTGAYFDNNVMYFGPIQHPVPMRVSVSMTSFGTPGIKLNGSPQTGFTFAVGVASNQGTWVEATKASHGITNSIVLNLNMATTSDYFIFSAEL